MDKPRIAFALALALPTVLLGLAHGTLRDHEPVAQAAPPARADDSIAPPGMPRVDPPDGNFAGEVRELVDAGSYTYLLVTTERGGHEWVVTLGDGAPVGSRVEIVNMGVRTEFHSRRLARTFDRLVFAIVRERG